MQNYVYDTNFTRDVLTVGMTRCEKTYFTQKLAVNNFFGKIKTVEWVSYIDLDEEREAEVESCLCPDVDFHYPKLIEQLEGLLEFFKARSRTVKKNDDNSSSDDEFFNESDGFGEKNRRLIYCYGQRSWFS